MNKLPVTAFLVGEELKNEARNAVVRQMAFHMEKDTPLIQEALYTIGRPELTRTPEQAAAMARNRDFLIILRAIDPDAAVERDKARAERKAAAA